jgi:hypothetical protein
LLLPLLLLLWRRVLLWLLRPRQYLRETECRLQLLLLLLLLLRATACGWGSRALRRLTLLLLLLWPRRLRRALFTGRKPGVVGGHYGRPPGARRAASRRRRRERRRRDGAAVCGRQPLRRQVEGWAVPKVKGGRQGCASGRSGWLRRRRPWRLLLLLLSLRLIDKSSGSNSKRA